MSLAVDQDASCRGFDQAVEHAHQGGFARARQAHDDEDFSSLDVKVRVKHANGLAGFFKNVLFGMPLAHQLQRVPGVCHQRL